MAFYKSPFRPFDPVIPSEGSPESIRYLRDNFSGTGQDSFTDPPAQDQAQWEQLLNVMPIFQGTLSQRWGSQLWTPATIDATGTYVGHFSPFQRTDGTRNIIASFAGPTTYGASAYGEDGTFNSNLVSRATAGDPPFRAIPSRNYAYLYNGTPGNTKKWDGTNAVTNWGINVNGITNSSSAKFAGTAYSPGSWSGASNATGSNNGSLATSSTTAAGYSTWLGLDNYGLSVSGTVLGIQADIYCGGSITSTAPKTIRPTTNLVSGGGNTSNPTYAYDNNLSTATRVSAFGPNGNASGTAQATTWYGMPSIGSPTPSTLKLTIVSGGSANSDAGGGALGTASVSYSLNGGSTWITLWSINSSGGSTATMPKRTDVINLSPTQNTTLVQVRANAVGRGSNLTGTVGDGEADVYEISVSSTYPSATGTITLIGQLVKNGTAYGAWRAKNITVGANGVYTLGGSTDLWSGAFTSTDVNASNFGINIIFSCSAASSLNIDAVRLTVYMSGGGPSITSTASAGNVTLIAGRTYYLVAKNSSTGHYSDLSAASTSTGAITNKQVSLTLPVFTDSQVDTKALLATADGNDPSILYLVTELANATTTYNDNTPDTSLVLNQVLLTTDDLGNEIGVSNNTPPPNISLAIKHKGRLWGAVNQNLFFSKSVSELTLPNGFVAGKYEEAWPASNYFDVSMGAENIRALFSDGQILYIGTERHIYQLYGDNPDNFQVPEMIHQEVGVLNQEVVQPVYLEGAPSGAIWLTPDNRVIGSDFNAYADVGHPIQDVLNNINASVAQGIAHAMFVSSGEFDLYILAIPTGTNTLCDTHCVFDLRNKQWYIWQPTDPSTAMLFNVNAQGVPQWLYATEFSQGHSGTACIFQYLSTASTDRTAINNVSPVVFPVSATTSWMHLGTPTQRKILNELDIVGDPNMTVTVAGADTQADFQNPITVVSNQSLVVDSLNHVKLFLAGTGGPNRYYQFTFTASGNSIDFLDSYAILAYPVVSL